MTTPYVPQPKIENPAPQPPEYGDHDPSQAVTLATIRARIDQWQQKQEQP